MFSFTKDFSLSVASLSYQFEKDQDEDERPVHRQPGNVSQVWNKLLSFFLSLSFILFFVHQKESLYSYPPLLSFPLRCSIDKGGGGRRQWSVFFLLVQFPVTGSSWPSSSSSTLIAACGGPKGMGQKKTKKGMRRKRQKEEKVEEWWCKKKAPPRSYRSWPQSRTHIKQDVARATLGRFGSGNSDRHTHSLLILIGYARQDRRNLFFFRKKNKPLLFFSVALFFSNYSSLFLSLYSGWPLCR